MNLQRFFLLAFVLAFASAALLAIGVILFGKWDDLEVKMLTTTISIGGYSLIALCCATIYRDPRWQVVSVLGLIVCGIGLTFALLTNWRIIKPKLDDLLKGRFAFLSLAMALAATALMLRLAPQQSVVRFSQNATIFMIWLTTLLFNYILFFVVASGARHDAVFRMTAASSILALLGLVTTPILRKVYP